MSLVRYTVPVPNVSGCTVTWYDDGARSTNVSAMCNSQIRCIFTVPPNWEHQRARYAIGKIYFSSIRINTVSVP